MREFTRAAILCSGFIASFYIWRKERRLVSVTVFNTEDPIYKFDRNDPIIVKQRITSFIIACAAGSLLGRYFCPAGENSHVSGSEVVKTTVFCVTSTLALFLGPLYEMLSGKADKPTFEFDICFFRDIVVAPIGEELFFRGLILDTFQGYSDLWSILLSSVLFSLSHTHHIFYYVYSEFEDQEGPGCDDPSSSLASTSIRKRCWASGWKRLLSVYGITFVFGMLSGLYRKRVCKSSVIPIAATHSLCNFLGAPPLTFLDEESGETKREKCTTISVYILGIVSWILLLKAHMRSAD